MAWQTGPIPSHRPVERPARAADLAPPRQFDFGAFRLLPDQRLVERSGVPLLLGGRAMDILIALVERAGEVICQRELIDLVWPNVHVDDGNLRHHVVVLRRALDDGVDGARYVVNVPGRGYCFVCPVSPPSGGVPTRTVPAPRPSTLRGLPSRLDRMVGRAAEVGAIAALLANHRCLTIVGPGGIGKTTVAVAVGHVLADAEAEVCFVDLGPLRDPDLVAGALAAALGVGAAPDDPIGGVVAALRAQRLLLILDSCEHVIDAAAALAEAIHDQAPEVRVLATSREALRIEGEQLHRLSPLACPPCGEALTAADALAYPAVQLFAERAVSTCPSYVFGDADAPAVARICRKLDGIALAIELAAGRIDAFGVEGVEALLDSKLSLLWQGRRTAPPRHQTLNATFDWSYDLLSGAEQHTLRRLVGLTGAFSLDAAHGAAQMDGADLGIFAEQVATLVAKSLVVSEAGHGGPRYRLLDTTRAYLNAKLADEAATARA
jgi:predicted ATPase/DNA-binding winged helix-turn-helix (wHTH) protein